ncbi:MAG: hypothetical protein MUQ25_02535 [Candidatus Aminicenantes bacterium]|nr:hypothetical protein [Candidatus Aminicenantes bacterium]
MEIYLEKARNLLHVLFKNAEFTDMPFEDALFKRHFGVHKGVTFIFEKTGKGFILYIGFDRYKDPAVLSRINDGHSVEEMQVLWKLAQLPRARIFSSKVLLPDGRSVEIIDTVAFELRKVREGVWESEKNETEVNRRFRQMRLNRLRDEVPGIFIESSLGGVVAAGKELLFSDTLTESESGTQSSGSLSTVDAPNISEERDPDEIANCDRCEKLYYEEDLAEVQPGFYLCPFCLENPVAAMELGLVADRRFGKDPKFKKPTAEDVNKAIQLLLWRCRDAQLHKNAPQGKRGFYELDDWITKANDDMISELGLWCADIQELNIGTRDS